MSRRLPAWIVLPFGLLVASVAAAEPTTLAPGQSVAASEGAPPPTPSKSLARFELLARAGYGSSTGKVYGIELQPYAATFGVESGYVFANGLRLAAYLDFGLGRSVNQPYETRGGTTIELAAKTSSLNAGVSFGYDLWLYFLVLRYTLNVGFTSLSWDFGDTPGSAILDYAGQATHGSKLGFNVAPGLTALWSIGPFECGLGFDYFAQIEDRIPSGFLGKVLVGVML
jgi:hypothetical protein